MPGSPSAVQLKTWKGFKSNSNQIELSQIKQAQHSITFDQIYFDILRSNTIKPNKTSSTFCYYWSNIFQYIQIK